MKLKPYLAVRASRNIWFLLLCMVLVPVSSWAQRIAPEKWIPTSIHYQNPPCGIDLATANQLAKFDIIGPTSVTYNKCLTGAPSLFAYLKTLNPDQIVWHYQNGPALYTTNAGLPIGTDGISWIRTNHGTTSSDRWTAKGRTFGGYLVGGAQYCSGGVECDNYNNTINMNLTNTNWTAYWIRNAFNLQGRPDPYSSGTIDATGLDGVWADNTHYPIPPTFVEGHSGDPAYRDDPTDYSLPFISTNPDFHAAALNFASAATAGLAAIGKTFALNWVNLGSTQAWSELDSLPNPPFAGMAECQGACAIGAPFSAPEDFPGTFNNMYNLTRTRVMFDNTTQAACANPDALNPQFSDSGTLHCYDIVWYQMGVFMMGFNTETGNGIFGYSVAGDPVVWYDEWDPSYIHLGHQIGTFSTPQTGVYVREFEDGWFVINSTISTVTLGIPGGGQARIIDHSNFKNGNNVPLSSSVTLRRNRAVILLKPGRDITNADNRGSGAVIPLMITTATPMPSGTVGTAYSMNLTASGGNPGYTWSIVSGSLPDGLTRTAALISGTPTRAGTFNFTVRVTDLNAGTMDKALSIAIADAPAPSGTSTPSVTVPDSTGSSYSRSQIASDGFTSSTSQCLNAYSSNWTLINDGGTVNCVKVDPSKGVIYGATDSYTGWVARRTESGYLDNQFASLRITAMPADDSDGFQFVGVGVRIAAATGSARSLYETLVYKAGTTQFTALVKVAPIGYATLTYTTGIFWSVGDRIELEANGSDIKTLRNGVVVLSYTDSAPLAGGTPGVIMAGGTGSLSAGDDFLGGNLTTGDSQTNPTTPTSPSSGTLGTLSLVISRNGTVLRSKNIPIYVDAADTRVQKLELYINGIPVASADGVSLLYRWDTRRLSGKQTIDAFGYDSSNTKIAAATAIVTVQ